MDFGIKRWPCLTLTNPHSAFPVPQLALARLRGFEPPTHGSGGRCSIRAELQAHDYCNSQFQGQAFWLVGVRGFEPPTPCSQSRCASRLRHTPKTIILSRLKIGLYANLS